MRETVSMEVSEISSAACPESGLMHVKSLLCGVKDVSL